jgi:hypothetical protein
MAILMEKMKRVMQPMERRERVLGERTQMEKLPLRRAKQ